MRSRPRTPRGLPLLLLLAVGACTIAYRRPEEIRDRPRESGLGLPMPGPISVELSLHLLAKLEGAPPVNGVIPMPADKLLRANADSLRKRGTIATFSFTLGNGPGATARRSCVSTMSANAS